MMLREATNMLSEKEYFATLYENIISKNASLFLGCDEKHLSDIPIEGNCFERLYELLNQVENNYGFDMQKMILPNYKKFVLWQRCFLNDFDATRVKIATEFIVFCCLVDKILDSNRFSDSDKELVCQKLNARYFFAEHEYKSDGFFELDILLNNIRSFIVNSKSQEEQEKLLCFIDKALVSEVYMYRNTLEMNDKMSKSEHHLLIDKSVEFEKAAFLLASFGNNTKKSESSAENVGVIFWIIDDLCDLIEDMGCKRRNSILFMGVNSEEVVELSQRFNIACANLNIFIEILFENLNNLKDNSNTTFYNYILNEVWEWCTSVRKMAKANS